MTRVQKFASIAVIIGVLAVVGCALAAEQAQDLHESPPVNPPTQAPDDLPPPAADDADHAEPEFVGLPFDFCLPQPSSGAEASRIGVGGLMDMFGTDAWGMPVQAFAFVRVIDTAQEGDNQISTVQVLRTVWTRERELPDVLTLTQFSGAIMCCRPYGEMMREGAVFLLPLWHNDGTLDWRRDTGWFNRTYFDVLFEIDDGGVLRSRSTIGEFNRFDGLPVSVLTNAILAIAHGEENLGRDIARTSFGPAADTSALVAVTMLSEESMRLFPTGREIWENTIVVRMDEIWGLPALFGRMRGGWADHQQRWREHWRTSEHCWQDMTPGGRIGVTNTSFARNVMDMGGRYLVFVGPSYSNWSAQFTLYSGSVARINADGTITPVSGEGDIRNVFNAYSGYTVEQIADLVHLVNTWHLEYLD